MHDSLFCILSLYACSIYCVHYSFSIYPSRDTTLFIFVHVTPFSNLFFSLFHRIILCNTKKFIFMIQFLKNCLCFLGKILLTFFLFLWFIMIITFWGENKEAIDLWPVKEAGSGCISVPGRPLVGPWNDEPKEQRLKRAERPLFPLSRDTSEKH